MRLRKQISEVIIHEDGRREAIYRRLGPNGETHSQELQDFLGPCICTICGRPMYVHSLKDFGDHYDKYHEQLGWAV